MASNFQSKYLTALDGLIVAMGGTVPTAIHFNFRMAELSRVMAIATAAGAGPVATSINYEQATLRNWAAAIAALGGTIPPPQMNYRQALLLHVQALQAARGVTVAIAGNFEDAMLGLLGASVLVFDADAQSIITATETTDGQSLEFTVRNAINTFVVGCKADGIYAPLSSGVWRLMAGPRTLAGIIKCGRGADPTNFNFVAGDYIRSSGLKGNASTKYLNANRLATADGQNNYHLSTYVHTPPSTNTVIMGSRATSPTNGYRYNPVGPTMIGWSHTINSSMTVTAAPGLIALRRFEVTAARLFANGLETNFINTSITPTALDYYVFGCNENGTNALSVTDARLSWYSIGPDLGESKLALLRARLDSYLTSILGI